MTKTKIILEMLSKRPFTANQLLKALEKKLPKKDVPPNIRSNLWQLWKQKRIKRISDGREYKYVTVKSDADIKFLYDLMNENMEPNKKIISPKLRRIKRIEMMLK